MIICGYPCIGKTSLIGKSQIIDLDSSTFHTISPIWYETYVRAAVDLSRQGFIVLISSHDAVRSYLSKNYPDVSKYICCPALELKDAWIKKLYNRYKKSQDPKDFRAWSRAVDHYDGDITDMQNECKTGVFKLIEIPSMKYSLYDLIRSGSHSTHPESEVVQMTIYDAPDIDYPYDHTWDI